MYTSFIGKSFLKYYNAKNGKSLSAKEYFNDIYFPLFYDREKYLHSPGNTPLFQLIAQKKTHDSIEREKGRMIINQKIEEYNNGAQQTPDMSFAIGYRAKEINGTTSGQVSSLDLPVDEDDVYASWIGSGLGIGIKGGINLLIDNNSIYEALEIGWDIYSLYVDENPDIGNKIESWNGIWLNHFLGDDYSKSEPRANFSPIILSKDNVPSLERESWVRILFSLSKVIPQNSLNVYAYSLEDMNKTLGFIQFALPEVTGLSGLYKTLYQKNPLISNSKIEALYEAEFSFFSAFERFSKIGLRALEPKDLRKYMPSSHSPLPKLKTDENSIINYFIYEIWIIAMLNNKELLELSERAANGLAEFVKGEKQIKTTRENYVRNLLSAKNRKDFIENLCQIVKEDKSLSIITEELVNRVMLDISPDNISLFITLLRFKLLTNTEIKL